MPPIVPVVIVMPEMRVVPVMPVVLTQLPEKLIGTGWHEAPSLPNMFKVPKVPAVRKVTVVLIVPVVLCLWRLCRPLCQ